MKKFIKKVIDLVYPKGLTCIVCGKELKDDERYYAICNGCKQSFIEVNKTFDINDKILGTSCFIYDDKIRKLVLQYKDSSKPYIAEYLAKYMADCYKKNQWTCDCMVYVPSNKATLKNRGYDALYYVAKNLSKQLELPILDGLAKHENVVDLAKVEISKRKDAIKDAFYIDKNNMNFLKRNVLIVDDVITTGATLTECIKQLKIAGVNDIKVLTFAIAKNSMAIN